MYVIIQHNITSPAKFWEIVKGVKSVPEGTKLHSTIPSSDGKKAVCIWQAPSVASVKNFVEPAVGTLSSNEYFEVNEKDAMGLPK
jgi:hypothetical protein